jgi:hypothetical protein
MAMVEDMTLGADIDGQGIMAFADLQVDAKDHDPITNANEGEKVVTIEVECVEALVEGGGELSSNSNDVALTNDHDS